MVDTLLYISYALIFFAAVFAVVLPLVKTTGQKGALMKTGMGVLALVVVFLIGWAISGNEVLARYAEFDVGAGLSKLIGGFLIMTYILVIGAIIGIIYTESHKIIK